MRMLKNRIADDSLWTLRYGQPKTKMVEFRLLL